jgi:hypothetical protein
LNRGEAAYLPLPFSQNAGNVDLGIVSPVRLKEERLLERLAEGCMLRGSECLRSFCNPLLGFSLRESLDEICMVMLAIICERSRGGTRCHVLNKAGYSGGRESGLKGARDAIYELGS